MLLPGPDAQQLATYVGWLPHRGAGGLVAGGLFILPGLLSILALSVLYAGFQNTTLVQARFFDLKPAVLAVEIEAVIRIGRRALRIRISVLLAVFSFVAIFFLDLPFPVIVVSAGLIGFFAGLLPENPFLFIGAHSNSPVTEARYATETLVDAGRPPAWLSIRTAAIWLLIWLGLLAILAAVLGTNGVFVKEGIFFSKAAMVTFGGAYAVLAYVAQQAVETYGWLQPGEMLDGLGMAETTPGPLIQVVQFVGFMGAFRMAGGLDPMMAGILGSVLVTWVTFAPCFLWIFVGAPYVEYLRGLKPLSTALSAITAAVVGVVLNLAVWFALHTLFGEVLEIVQAGVRLYVPDWRTIDLASLAIATVAALLLFRFKLGMIRTLAVSSVLGFLYYAVFLGS